MTSVLAAPAPAAAAAPHRIVRFLLAVLPWVLVAVVLAVALHRAGTPVPQILLYGFYLLIGVVVPGTLVHRALRGSRGNLPEDVGYGAATGLLVQLAGWAAAAATGLQALLPGWPLLVIAAFVVVPGLRRHWRIAEPEPLPLRWSWLVCGALLGVVLWGAAAWTNAPLPPVDAIYYQDLYYHLALVHEMTRSMPFQVPQIAGETLRYHYLSDADMAAASMITGIPPATVLLRLWTVPIAAIAVLVLAALARELSGKWWTGPLAGGVAIVGLPLTFGAPGSSFGGASVAFLSPSQTYAMPLLGLLVAVVVDLLRGRELGPARVLGPVLAFACTGVKSSALPPLVAGLALAGLVLWLRDRRFPRAVGVFLVVTIVAMLAGALLFAGGGAGTLSVQLLSVLHWLDPYRRTLGAGDETVPDGLVPLGVQDAGGAGRWFIVWVVVWWLLIQAPRLLGLASLRRRSDPAAWLLGGMVVAGLLAVWTLWHPSASQVYFYTGAAPFGVLLTVWMLAERTRRWWVPVGGLLAGAVWSILTPALPRPAQGTIGAWSWALALPMLRTLAVGLVAVLLLVVLRRRRVLVVAVTAAVLGASLGAGLDRSAGQVWRDAYGPEPPPLRATRVVTADEMRAALWLDGRAGKDDVVATNVHCTPVHAEPPCDARAFWVAGLGGRRALLESWGYSDASVAAHGVGGRSYVVQPPADQARYALNERVFTRADPADLAEVRRHGVRWLLADARAGAVSPRLAQQAPVRYTAGPVTIYELL